MLCFACTHLKMSLPLAIAPILAQAATSLQWDVIFAGGLPPRPQGFLYSYNPFLSNTVVSEASIISGADSPGNGI